MPEKKTAHCPLTTDHSPGWLDLFRCFHIASDPAKVWLGFLGVIFTIFALLLALAFMLKVRQLSGSQVSRDTLASIRNGNIGRAAQLLGDGLRSTAADLRLEVRDLRRALRTGVLGPASRRTAPIRTVVPWALGTLLLLWLPGA